MSYISQVLPSLLDGAVVTLQVFCIVIVLSIPIGAILAFLMQIKFKPLQWLLTLYVWIMRGTPLLLQLIFFYYVLPSVGVVMDRMPAAILAFTLNYAAYFAEIFRGGIAAIPKGQYEAAKVLKLNQLQTIHYIILPQVFKIVLPSVFNEIINLVKDSSLVYVLGVGDLLLASKTAANRDATLAPMFVAGGIYLLMIGIVTLISKQTEKKFDYYK
ncbi:amino acid ABC transporter, permease protein [Streptococcus infantarius subsp. infantarius]|nr:amino acid ABC transporter, permease protein [Streptococcus infantarius subsp. infantarius]